MLATQALPFILVYLPFARCAASFFEQWIEILTQRSRHLNLQITCLHVHFSPSQIKLAINLNLPIDPIHMYPYIIRTFCITCIITHLYYLHVIMYFYYFFISFHWLSYIKHDQPYQQSHLLIILFIYLLYNSNINNMYVLHFIFSYVDYIYSLQFFEAFI